MLLIMLVVSSGCMNSPTTRYPTLVPRAAETERRAAQIKDPYPDSRMGPEVGFRPTEYQQQRAEPVIAKDRFYSGFVSRPRLEQPSPGPQGVPGPQGAVPVPAF